MVESNAYADMRPPWLCWLHIQAGIDRRLGYPKTREPYPGKYSEWRNADRRAEEIVRRDPDTPVPVIVDMLTEEGLMPGL